MKIAILSRNRRLYSTRRLIEAAEERGHEVMVLDALRVYMNITSGKPQIHYKGETIGGFDAVIPRIGKNLLQKQVVQIFGAWLLAARSLPQ